MYGMKMEHFHLLHRYAFFSLSPHSHWLPLSSRLFDSHFLYNVPYRRTRFHCVCITSSLPFTRCLCWSHSLTVVNSDVQVTPWFGDYLHAYRRNGEMEDKKPVLYGCEEQLSRHENFQSGRWGIFPFILFAYFIFKYLTIYSSLILTSQFSSLILPSAGITGTQWYTCDFLYSKEYEEFKKMFGNNL